MKIELYEWVNNDRIFTITNYKSILDSYNELLTSINKNKYHYFKIHIHSITNINIIIYKNDLKNIKNYIKLVNYIFKFYDYGLDEKSLYNSYCGVVGKIQPFRTIWVYEEDRDDLMEKIKQKSISLLLKLKRCQK